MMMNETIKLILAVLVGCAVLFGYQTVMEWREGAQQNVQRGQTMAATSGILADAGKTSTQRVQVDIGVAGAKQAFKDALEEAKKNEPDTLDRADRPVPASVRDAYRQRRLARERSGRASVGGEAGAAKADPTQR